MQHESQISQDCHMQQGPQISCQTVTCNMNLKSHKTVACNKDLKSHIRLSHATTSNLTTDRHMHEVP
jgi:hypothetical protein